MQVSAFPLENPSCSKQHAVIQFRKKTIRDVLGNIKSVRVKPYLLDLKSTNGTWLNGERIDDSKFYELIEKDCIKFGTSCREYVVLREDSK